MPLDHWVHQRHKVDKVKSKQLSPPIQRQKRNSSTQDSFHSFLDTKIGYHFSDYKKTHKFTHSLTLAATKANKKR